MKQVADQAAATVFESAASAFYAVRRWNQVEKHGGEFARVSMTRDHAGYTVSFMRTPSGEAFAYLVDDE